MKRTNENTDKQGRRTKPTQQLHEAGQSLWLDNYDDDIATGKAAGGDAAGGADEDVLLDLALADCAGPLICLPCS